MHMLRCPTTCTQMQVHATSWQVAGLLWESVPTWEETQSVARTPPPWRQVTAGIGWRML